MAGRTRRRGHAPDPDTRRAGHGVARALAGRRAATPAHITRTTEGAAQPPNGLARRKIERTNARCQRLSVKHRTNAKVGNATYWMPPGSRGQAPYHLTSGVRPLALGPCYETATLAPTSSNFFWMAAASSFGMPS